MLSQVIEGVLEEPGILGGKMRKETRYQNQAFFLALTLGLSGCGDIVVDDINVGKVQVAENIDVDAQGELNTGDIDLKDPGAPNEETVSFEATLAALEASETSVLDLVGREFLCSSKFEVYISHTVKYTLKIYEDGTGETLNDTYSEGLLSDYFTWEDCAFGLCDHSEPIPDSLAFTYQSNSGLGGIYGLELVGDVLKFYNYNTSDITDHVYELTTCKELKEESIPEEVEEELDVVVEEEASEPEVQEEQEDVPVEVVEPKILTFKEECAAKADPDRSPPSLHTQNSDGTFYRKCTESSDLWGVMNYQLEFFSNGTGHVYKNDHSLNRGALPTDVDFTYELLLGDPGTPNDGGGVLYLKGAGDQTTVSESCITSHTSTGGIATIDISFKRRQVYAWDDQEIQTSQIICTDSNNEAERISKN